MNNKKAGYTPSDDRALAAKLIRLIRRVSHQGSQAAYRLSDLGVPRVFNPTEPMYPGGA
jgi:hypothetical protein